MSTPLCRSMNLVSTPGASTWRRYMPGAWRCSIQRTVASSRSQSSASRSARIGWAVSHGTRRVPRAASISPARRRTSAPTRSSAQASS